jgi:hypothetical protein
MRIIVALALYEQNISDRTFEMNFARESGSLLHERSKNSTATSKTDC